MGNFGIDGHQYWILKNKGKERDIFEESTLYKKRQIILTCHKPPLNVVVSYNKYLAHKFASEQFMLVSV